MPFLRLVRVISLYFYMFYIYIYAYIQWIISD